VLVTKVIVQVVGLPEPITTIPPELPPEIEGDVPQLDNEGDVLADKRILSCTLNP
jgi:hypothetical protein